MSDEEVIKSGGVMHELSLMLVQHEVEHSLRTHKPYGMVLHIPLRYGVMSSDLKCKFGYFMLSKAFKPILEFGPTMSRREFDNLKRILLEISVPVVLGYVPLWPNLSKTDVEVILHLLRIGRPVAEVAHLMSVSEEIVIQIRLTVQLREIQAALVRVGEARSATSPPLASPSVWKPDDATGGPQPGHDSEEAANAVAADARNLYKGGMNSLNDLDGS